MRGIYKDLLRPLLFRANAENVHELGLKTLRAGLSTDFAQKIAAKRFKADGPLAVEQFGLRFENPVGIAAGFDKNGIVVDQLAALGFGFAEAGTVTLNPQPGNKKPRMFRLPKDGALINRLGFNNKGAKAAAHEISKSKRKCVIGINIGKNKDVPNEEAVENYVSALEIVYSEADYIAINVSSPNTPDLRELQNAAQLELLLTAVSSKMRELGGGETKTKPLLLKIAPDLLPEAVDEVVDICRSLSVDGIIATNTTTARANLNTSAAELESIGAGGLSGRPLQNVSNGIVSRIYSRTKGTLPIVGVGGIFTAKDAFEKICAGASLVQGYTGFVYRGPAYARDINRGLIGLLEENGFASPGDAVGSAVDAQK